MRAIVKVAPELHPKSTSRWGPPLTIHHNPYSFAQNLYRPSPLGHRVSTKPLRTDTQRGSSPETVCNKVNNSYPSPLSTQGRLGRQRSRWAPKRPLQTAPESTRASPGVPFALQRVTRRLQEAEVRSETGRMRTEIGTVTCRNG